MAQKPNRLSVRIPWFLEAVADGPIAIAACTLIVGLVLAARGLGWW